MIETVFRSEDQPVTDRLDWWRELTSHTLMPTMITSDDADAFRAESRLLDMGAVQMSMLSYSALRARRTPALVRRSDPELYHLALTLQGAQGISHHGRDTRVSAGDLLLYDSSHSCDARTLPAMGATKAIIVNIPRAGFPLPAGQVDHLLAVPLRTGGVGTLLSQFLTRLAAESAAYRPQDVPRLGAVTVDLITVFLAHHLDAQGTVSPDSRRRVLMVSIHSFIERNLGDTRLSPSVVAAAHHISVRYLHRLFQSEGITVGSRIRERRLERCCRDLADPALSDQPVGSLGVRWGFRDASQFSRAFGTAYRMPPAEYRRSALTGNRCAPGANDISLPGRDDSHVCT